MMFQFSPLHIAVYHGKMKLLECIMETATDKKPENEKKWTPLHQACLKSNFDAVKTIMENASNKYPTNSTSEKNKNVNHSVISYGLNEVFTRTDTPERFLYSERISKTNPFSLVIVCTLAV